MKSRTAIALEFRLRRNGKMHIVQPETPEHAARRASGVVVAGA